MLFELLTGLVGVLGGAIAAVSGFGIGSTLTPLLAVRVGAKLAVAAVSIPHFLGTALRLWKLRRDVDCRVLATFGLMNAAGGLLGAFLHGRVQSATIRFVFGSLLVFAGAAGLSGLAQRLRFRGWSAWIAGFVSGGLGGLSGTQGGIRAAALWGFDLPKRSFVATSTATGILVDCARMPVYLWFAWDELTGCWPLILIASAGVVAGTMVGERVLRLIPERTFQKLVAGMILTLGVAMIFLLNTGRN